MSERTLAAALRLVKLGVEEGFTVGTAESCTGGLVCAAITSVPGSSAVLRGGVVSYDPQVKHDVLGVDEAVIADPDQGVVSEACARQMARGALRVLRCDRAVSITGIAGPGGAEPGKPVGTVWFGLAEGERTHAVRHHFKGDREEVRDQAVCVALELLYEGMLNAADHSEAENQ